MVDIYAPMIFLLAVFSVLMTRSACGIMLMIQKWLGRLRQI